jgi:hypothetical protein
MASSEDGRVARVAELDEWLPMTHGGSGRARARRHDELFYSQGPGEWEGECWWKSGPKGGRRHSSPLSSLPPFARSRKVSTST